MKQWLKQKLKLYPIIKTKYLREKTTILTQNITIIRLPLNKTYQKLCLFSLKLWQMDQNKSKPPQPKKKKKKLYNFFHNQNTFFTEQKTKKKKIWKIIETEKSTVKHCSSEKKKGTPEQEILENKPLFSWVWWKWKWKWNGNWILGESNALHISHRERETNVVVLIRSCELVLGLTNKKQKKRHGLRQDNNVKFLFCCKK